MPDFSVRDTTPELMDTEVVSFEDFRECLRQLTDANRLTFAYRPTLSLLERLRRSGLIVAGRPFFIVDAGSGYGDMARAVDRWAAARGLDIRIDGVDVNPWSARAAAEATPQGRPLRWVTADIFTYQPPMPVDLVMSSLFTHHLPGATLTRFVSWMEETAQTGWLVNDLHRHPLPYYGLKAAFWATRRHRFMRHDGPVSVASAFKPGDWREIAAAAGLPPGAVTIERIFPFRLRISRLKGSAR